MFTVVIIEKGGKKKRVQIAEDAAIIGREPGNDIVLAVGNVSKRHCRVTFLDGKFTVEDVGSTNGTYVNGRRIPGPTLVGAKDKVYVGEFIIMLDAGVDSGEVDEPSDAANLPSRPPPPPVPRPKTRRSAPPPPRPPERPTPHPAIAESFTSLSATEEAALPQVKSDFHFEGRSRSSSPAPRRQAPALSGRLEQLVDFVALEVSGVDRRNLPCRLDEASALKVRGVLRGMLSELLREGRLEEDENPHSLLMDAFLAIVDLGPISDILRDRTVVEALIIGPDDVNIRTGTGWGASSQRFESARDLVRAIRCLGAGLPGAVWDGLSGCARFRLESGALVVAQTAPLANPAVVRIHRFISERLDKKAGISSALRKEALSPIREGIAAGGRMAVAGNCFSLRMSLLADLIRLLPVDAFVAVVEDTPLLGVGGPLRVGLDGSALDRRLRKGHEDLISGAVQLRPDWLVVSGITWTEMPALLDACARRSAVIADIPLPDLDASGKGFCAGLLASGISVLPAEALAVFAAAFDWIVVAGQQGDGLPTIAKVYRLDESDGTPRIRELYTARDAP